MNQFHIETTHSILNNSEKLLKLNYLLQNSKITVTSKLSRFPEFSSNLSKDLPFYLSLIEKPINLLFSSDQFFFEFSKKTYQQKKTGEFFQQLKKEKN